MYERQNGGGSSTLEVNLHVNSRAAAVFVVHVPLHQIMALRKCTIAKSEPLNNQAEPGSKAIQRKNFVR